MHARLKLCLKIGSQSCFYVVVLTLAGEDGPQAQKITAQAEQIAKNCQLPLEFTDERLSSAEAKKILRAQGLSEKAMRGKVDMVAASLFLQSWLDAQMNKGD